jgi:hypothetical protein
MRTMNEQTRKTSVRELYPHLEDAELIETENRLKAYARAILKLCDQLSKTDNRYPQFGTLTPPEDRSTLTNREEKASSPSDS